MNQAHPASWSEEELLAHCKLTFSRASGPGGQNRNKVETSVQVEFLPAGIVAHASERRSQNENRIVALQRLRCKLAVEFRHSQSDPSHSTTLSELWTRYCRNGRINIADTNSDWPTILAELIATLEKCDWNVTTAAASLTTSSSQLVKLLKKHPPAFARINVERKVRNQRPLS